MITIVLLILFAFYCFISFKVNIPDRLFPDLDVLKRNVSDGWLWLIDAVDLIKYLLDKIGWAIVLFLFQKKYDKTKIVFPPIRCTLLQTKPVKYDSHLHQLSFNRKLEVGFGRYYYHFPLQLDAEENNYYNVSLKGLRSKKLRLDYLGDGKKFLTVDLLIYFSLQRKIELFPIYLKIYFCDNTNTKYVEKVLLIHKDGEYRCNIKVPRKCVF